MRVLLSIAVLSALAGPAAAQDIFKFTKPDGTVTYTDSLAALPEKVRAEYNKKIAAREAARAELAKSVGKEELARREAEAEQRRLLAEQADTAERRKRLETLDLLLRAAAEKEKARGAEKAKWQGRVRAARENVKKLYMEFRAAEAKVEDLGARASFSLLPGQAEELEKAREALAKLGPQLDQAILELEQKIPDEARRAGIPPGWLRDA